MISTGPALLSSILAEQSPLALHAAMRLRRYVQTQFNPNSEQSIVEADALYRAALFAIRERDAHSNPRTHVAEQVQRLDSLQWASTDAGSNPAVRFSRGAQ